MTVAPEPTPGGPTELRDKVARRLRGQGQGCEKFGSRLYARVLPKAADDVEAGGPVWSLLSPHANDPGGSMLALRLMGATHRLALDGTAPALAAHYPSTGGDGDADQAWVAWYELVTDRAEVVAPLIDRPVQTNEVGRAAALLAGFLTVARETGLPLRLLEIGTSAGLNLRWDRFRYATGDRSWGPNNSPVTLTVAARAAPQLDPEGVDVVERAGCDLHPVDPTSDDGRLTLLSFVWPDQTVRFANLAGACDLAALYPVTIDRSAADVWLRDRLGTARAGAATVVFHSVFWQYVDRAGRAGITEAIEAAGADATEDAPLAWLRLEPASTLDSDMEVRLTCWPGGAERRLAIAHPHGTWVRWLS